MCGYVCQRDRDRVCERERDNIGEKDVEGKKMAMVTKEREREIERQLREREK